MALGHGSSLPLDGIVGAMLNWLPLRADCGENAPALRALLQLTHAEATRAAMAPHVPALLSALGRALAPAEVDCLGAALRAEVGAFLAWLGTVVPAPQLAAATSSLPEAERAVLAANGLVLS